MNPEDQKHETLKDIDLESELDSIRQSLASDDDTPPAMLDQAILNSARRDLAKSRRRPFGWMGAVATAAVLVLAVTIVVQQDETPTPSGLERNNEIRVESQSDALPEKKSRELSDMSDDPSRGGREPTPDSRARLTPAMKTSTEAGDEVGAIQPASAPPLPEPAEEFRQKREAFGGEVSADTDDTANLPAPSLQSQDSLAKEKDQQIVTGQSRRDDESAVEEEEERSGIDSDSLEATTTLKLDNTESITDEPQQWIERMLVLKSNQQMEQLNQELAKFRAEFPDYQLPDELLD